MEIVPKLGMSPLNSLGGGVNLGRGLADISRKNAEREKAEQAKAKFGQLVGGELGELAALDPDLAMKAFGFQKAQAAITTDEERREVEEGARDAIAALSIKDPERRKAYLTSRMERLSSQGRDFSDTAELLSLPINERDAELKRLASYLVPASSLGKQLAGGGRVVGVPKIIERNGEQYFSGLREVNGNVERFETPLGGVVVAASGETAEDAEARRRREAEDKAKIKTDQAVNEQKALSEGKISLAQDLAKVTAKGARLKKLEEASAESINDAIAAGLDAQSRLPDVKRGLELLSKVSTGGLTATSKAVTDFFGTTSGDVAELNNILAQNVLAGLSNFKGAISDGERRFLEKMETNLAQGTSFNRQQLERMQKILEGQIALGKDAARARGDSFTKRRFGLSGGLQESVNVEETPTGATVTETTEIGAPQVRTIGRFKVEVE